MHIVGISAAPAIVYVCIRSSARYVYTMNALC